MCNTPDNNRETIENARIKVTNLKSEGARGEGEEEDEEEEIRTSVVRKKKKTICVRPPLSARTKEKPYGDDRPPGRTALCSRNYSVHSSCHSRDPPPVPFCCMYFQCIISASSAITEATCLCLASDALQPIVHTLK